MGYLEAHQARIAEQNQPDADSAQLSPEELKKEQSRIIDLVRYAAGIRADSEEPGLERILNPTPSQLEE